MENKINSSPNVTTWGIQSHNAHNKAPWLVIPTVEFKLRFSSIDIIFEKDEYIEILLRSGLTVRIGISRTPNTNCRVDSSTSIWLSYNHFQDFKNTLHNCFNQM